jgi:MraZ protein
MTFDHLFSGSAICSVSAEGGVTLPAFVRRQLERRSPGRAVMFGAHESDPCLTGCDVGHLPRLQADAERRRLREEAEGVASEIHHARLRRTFGFLEAAGYDDAGRIVLPPMVRRKGAIDDLALFVGTGDNFEVWNPQRARESGCDELRELADDRLARSES